MFLELISHEIGNLIPPGDDHEHEDDALADVQEFHEWLREKAPERYVQIAIKIADFLIQNEQASAALTMLEGLPEGRRSILRCGTASRSTGGTPVCASPAGSTRPPSTSKTQCGTRGRSAGPVGCCAEATAHKELGFYYRNLGRWAEADEAYLTARVGLSSITGPDSHGGLRPRRWPRS